MRIIKASPSHGASLAAFNVRMARETEGRELDPAVVRAGVSAVLEDPAKGFYLVAEDGSAIVGQLMVTYEWSDWRNGVFWWIQSVYVVPEARRRGIYRALHERVLDLAAEAEERIVGLRLYVEKENATARSTYEALEMRPTRYDLYELELPAR